jgi:hypothetical protein
MGSERFGTRLLCADTHKIRFRSPVILMALG